MKKPKILINKKKLVKYPIEDRIKDNLKYINNGTNKLMIVFQSAGRIPKEKLGTELSIKELKKYHSRLNYRKLMENKQYDYLYVMDNYNNSYGFYTVSDNYIITDAIVQEINAYLEGYEEVITFGTSKGGSAAIIFGNLIDKCDYIFSGVPILDQEQYIKNYMPVICEELIKTDIASFLLKNMAKELLAKTTIKTIIFTGVNDVQYNVLKSLELPENVQIQLDRTDKKHNEIIYDNIEYIYEYLYYEDKSKKMQDEYLKFPDK